jgi:hypothetical protein
MMKRNNAIRNISVNILFMQALNKGDGGDPDFRDVRMDSRNASLILPDSGVGKRMVSIWLRHH